MKLSEEEKKLILEKRKQEEDNEPKLVGYLKENFYQLTEFLIENDVISTTEKNELIKNFISSIKLVLPKGTKFFCYITNGKEKWFDSKDGWIEEADHEWAEKHLINIKPYPSRRAKK